MNDTKQQKENIVAGGGWIATPVKGRALASRFVFLSLLWIGPSLGAGWILCSDSAGWRHAESFGQGVQAVRFEQWIAVAVGLLHPFFIWKAVRYCRKGPAGQKVIGTPNPDHDIRKLY